MKILLVIMLLIYSNLALSDEEIYQWVDENGNMQFSQTPPPHELRGKVAVEEVKVETASSYEVEDWYCQSYINESGKKKSESDAEHKQRLKNCLQSRKQRNMRECIAGLKAKDSELTDEELKLKCQLKIDKIKSND